MDQKLFENAKKERVQVKFEDVVKLKEIGNGAAGKVYFATIPHLKKDMALKTIYLRSDVEKMKNLLINEVKIHTKSKHKNIIKCYASKYIESEKSVNIVLEFMNKGSLSDVLKTKGKLEEKYLRYLAKELLEGLNYLHHTVRTIHRDLKPANILLNSRGEVKIADFGVSGFVKDTLDFRKTMIGTYLYMSVKT